MAPSYKQCLANISITVNLLSNLHFLINKNKSMLITFRSCRFLGFIFDTEYFAVSIPSDKRNKFLQSTKDILGKKVCINQS